MQAYIGGALVPWIYSIVILLVHIPVVIIRVVKWEAVQTWCLGATVFTIAITAQAFVSTGFRPDKILTWTPLLLVIDAGSMAQILFLIVEDYSLLTRLRHAVMPPQPIPSEQPFLNDEEASKSEDPNSRILIATRTVSPNPSTNPIPNHPPLFTSKPLYIALASTLLLISIFILQILGLHHAIKAASQPLPLRLLVQPHLPTLRPRRPRRQLQRLAHRANLPQGRRLHPYPGNPAKGLAESHRCGDGPLHRARVRRHYHPGDRAQRDALARRQDAAAVVHHVQRARGPRAHPGVRRRVQYHPPPGHLGEGVDRNRRRGRDVVSRPARNGWASGGDDWMERRRLPKLGKHVLWKLGVLGCSSENEDHVNDYCIFDHDRLFWKPLLAFLVCFL